jgi:hypothetical protein
MRSLTLTALVLTLAAAACGDRDPMAVESDLSVVAAGSEQGFDVKGSATFQVTVSNLTSGQPFTPPLAVVHRKPVRLFAMGEPASHMLQQIAENGNLDPMLMMLDGNKHADDVEVAFGVHGPLLPGETVTFEIEGQEGARYLSLVSMLVCTNDGFTGTAGRRLPKKVGDVVTMYGRAYDAGTEMNTEDFDNLVPPCSGGATGTGMSDPALAEGGVVHRHQGIQGIADLDPAVHGWSGAVAHIEIERIG